MNKEYVHPEIVFVEVVVEIGFKQSDSQQEPSPWEDM
jgi:hypothetical protein